MQHYERLSDGMAEGQHAQQQLEAVQQHRVHGFAHRRSVLSQLPGLQQDSHICKEDDDCDHCKGEQFDSSFEERLDRRWVDNSRFAMHRGGEDIHRRITFPDGEVNDREDAADEPERQNNDPDTVWAPGGRASQGVDDGNVTLQWHGGQDEGGVLESGDGYEEQGNTEYQSKFHPTHDEEEEQHRGRELEGVVDQHGGEQDVAGRVQELPVGRKDVQHDSDAAQEDAEERDDHTHLDDHRQATVGGWVGLKLSQILHFAAVEAEGAHMLKHLKLPVHTEK